MNYSTISLTIDAHVAEVVLNQPQSANAMNQEAWNELSQVFDNFNSNNEVHVVILSGSGKHFCAGIDLKLLGSIDRLVQGKSPAAAADEIRRLILDLQAPINKIEKCSKPVLAAVHGGCIGAGLDIVAACDIRYCTADGFFTLKEIDMAMVADLGSLQRLPKIMPEGLVREMAYTGRNVPAEEALRFGLVNQIFENKDAMLEFVRGIAKTISGKSSLAVRSTKSVLNHARESSIAEGLEYVATWNAGMLLSDDLKEAVKAFHEKRLPKFNRKNEAT